MKPVRFWGWYVDGGFFRMTNHCPREELRDFVALGRFLAAALIRRFEIFRGGGKVKKVTSCS